MADYYSILRKTIDGLPKQTPEIRQAVYTKARAAIEKQLRGMTPPPSEKAIHSQLELLEESILVVDSEYTLVSPAPESSVPETAPVPPAPTPEPVHAAAPQTPAVAPGPQEVSNTVSTPNPAASVESTPAPVAPLEASIDASVSPTPTASEQVVPPAETLPEATVAAPAVETTPPQTVSVEPAPMAGNSVNETPYGEPPEKSGIFGKLLGTLVILGLLGGAAYATWTNREALQPMIASVLGGDDKTEEVASDTSSETPSTDPLIDEDTAAQVEKEPVKLGADGEDTTVEPTQEEEPIVLQPEETPLVLENEDENSGTTEEPTVEPVQEVEETTNTETPTTPTVPLPPGEVAYLYEEGSAGAGATRTNAAVSWDLQSQSLAAGLSPEPVIVGTMEVPEKSLTMTVSIKRNVDDALSASHIIEMRFDVPEGFAGNSIDNIARFVMKATEEARGEPLVAVPVKVSDGFFLIALDNLQQAVDVNTQLMLESSWIDIPVSYATGKRALVTLEKGGTGERVFREAFRDWQNR